MWKLIFLNTVHGTFDKGGFKSLRIPIFSLRSGSKVKKEKERFFFREGFVFQKKSMENLFPLSISNAALQLWPRWRLGELQAPVQHLRVGDLHLPSTFKGPFAPSRPDILRDPCHTVLIYKNLTKYNFLALANSMRNRF